MIIKMVKNFNKYKSMMQVFTVIGLLLLIGSRFVGEDTLSGLLAGAGTSFVVIGIVNLLILTIKSKKNEDYEAEMEIEMSDERLQLNKLKGLAYAGVFGMMALAFSNIFHLLLDVNLLFSNIIIVFAYALILMGYKLFYKNR